MMQHDVTFRLSDDMLDALSALADEKGVAIGDLIREAISRDLRLRGALKAPGLVGKSPLFRVRAPLPEALRAD